MRGDDAAECVDAGVAAIAVSNHGGRTLDGTIATADALADVVDGVGGRAEVYVDGGIRNGSDIVKALALGARAVMIGRPVLWGLAVGGEDGAAGVLATLADDTRRALALCGAEHPERVTPRLRRAIANSCCSTVIPSSAKTPTDPAAIASGDFGGSEIAARTSSRSRAANAWKSTRIRSVPNPVATALPASHRVGHPITLQVVVADVGLEEAGSRDVAGLEEADHRGQPREALRVGIGAADQREGLELTLEVGAVVTEHVHEVVLGEEPRCAVRVARQREAASDVHLEDRAAEGSLGKVGERLPTRLELRIRRVVLERVDETLLRVHRLPRTRPSARRSRCAGDRPTRARTRLARTDGPPARSRRRCRVRSRTPRRDRRPRRGSVAARARRAPCGARSAAGTRHRGARAPRPARPARAGRGCGSRRRCR